MTSEILESFGAKYCAWNCAVEGFEALKLLLLCVVDKVQCRS